jgi:hypothetical protein
MVFFMHVFNNSLNSSLTYSSFSSPRTNFSRTKSSVELFIESKGQQGEEDLVSLFERIARNSDWMNHNKELSRLFFKTINYSFISKSPLIDEGIEERIEELARRYFSNISPYLVNDVRISYLEEKVDIEVSSFSLICHSRVFKSLLLIAEHNEHTNNYWKNNAQCVIRLSAKDINPKIFLLFIQFLKDRNPKIFSNLTPEEEFKAFLKFIDYTDTLHIFQESIESAIYNRTLTDPKFLQMISSLAENNNLSSFQQLAIIASLSLKELFNLIKSKKISETTKDLAKELLVAYMIDWVKELKQDVELLETLTTKKNKKRHKQPVKNLKKFIKIAKKEGIFFIRHAPLHELNPSSLEWFFRKVLTCPLELRLDNVSFSTLDSFSSRENYDRVKTLSLQNCKELTSMATLSHFKNLQNLDIRGCIRLTFDSLSVLEHLPNLIKIRLSSRQQFSPLDLMKLRHKNVEIIEDLP